MKELIQELKNLSKNYGIVGMKQSFEDEGVLLEDVITTRRLTDICGLLSFVKIGGCEAKSDIYNCIKYGIDRIIAPMVETKFALSKFTSIMSTYPDTIHPYIVIESKTAYDNLDEILDYGKHKLKGIVVGRSDFSKSYDLNKSEVDSEFIYDKVQDILLRCKTHNLYTTLGGNISNRSVLFIKNMYSKKLLNRIETRNVVIELTDDNIESIDESIKKSLEFEVLYLKYKHKIFSLGIEEYTNRIQILSNRS
jgi:hypothetical protein